MRQTWIGLSSFTYPFSCGIHPSQKPEALMTPIQLMDKALELSVTCVHFSHNMPLERCSDEDLQHIRKYAMTHGIRLENGMKHMTLERLRRCVVVSEQIGAKLLRIITDGPGYEPTVDEIVQILKEVIPVIEQSGLVLGIEGLTEEELNTKCYDCKGPDRICGSLLIHWQKPIAMDAEVLIIRDRKGF